MALIQASRPSGAGGGGGGLTINGWSTFQREQTTDFIAEEIVISLTETILAVESVVATYNGQVLLYNQGFSITGPNEITILFGDPYVTSYDSPPVFQFIYPY